MSTDCHVAACLNYGSINLLSHIHTRGADPGMLALETAQLGGTAFTAWLLILNGKDTDMSFCNDGQNSIGLGDHIFIMNVIDIIDIHMYAAYCLTDSHN